MSVVISVTMIPIIHSFASRHDEGTGAAGQNQVEQLVMESFGDTGCRGQPTMSADVVGVGSLGFSVRGLTVRPQLLNIFDRKAFRLSFRL